MMKRHVSYITGSLILTAGVALTLANGVIHGRLTDRWGDKRDLMPLAAARLAEFPEDFGDWRLVEAHPFGEYVLGILQCAGYVNRSYVNEKTGQVVNLAVIVGPFGPTSTHTPEICYSSRDYKVRETAQRVSLPSAPQSALWAVTLQSSAVHADVIRVLYAWSDGGPWSAPDQPRISYAGRPYLYKIQVSGLLSDSNKEDSCQSFLESFLPVFEPYLLPTQDE